MLWKDVVLSICFVQLIRAGHFKFILTLGKMALNNDLFLEDLQPHMNSIDKIVIDECHCILHWGPDFRPIYKQLGNLRAIFPVPILATMATLPSYYHDDVLSTLLFDEKKMFAVNLGNERPNIELDIRIMKGAKANPLPDFEDIFTEAATGCLRKHMVFIDNCMATQAIAELIIAKLPESMKSQVAYYHSEIGVQTKKVVMDNFVKGKVIES